MKLGLLTDPRRDLMAEIKWAVDHGFEVLDIQMAAPFGALEHTNWRTIGASVGDTGLLPICHAAGYLVIDNPSPLIRQAALDELRRSIDAAQRVGAALLTTRFRGWPSHLDEQAGYDYRRQVYAILVEHGRERGVRVALENSADNAHQLKYFREIFQRVPGLCLHYNVGNGNVNTAESMTRATICLRWPSDWHTSTSATMTASPLLTCPSERRTTAESLFCANSNPCTASAMTQRSASTLQGIVAGSSNVQVSCVISGNKQGKWNLNRRGLGKSRSRLVTSPFDFRSALAPPQWEWIRPQERSAPGPASVPIPLATQAVPAHRAARVSKMPSPAGRRPPLPARPIRR